MIKKLRLYLILERVKRIKEIKNLILKIKIREKMIEENKMIGIILLRIYRLIDVFI